MPKSRLSAVLSLLLVFVSGALVGVLAHRAYTLQTATAGPTQPRRREPNEWRKHFVDDMRQRVKLDDAQTAELVRIMDAVELEFRQVREKWNTENQAIQKSMVDRINATLRPEQQAIYKQFRDEREAERQRRRAQQPPEKK
jgi:hypothetical protein